MVVKVYKEIFEVTETLQNGRERRIRKSVITPRFVDGRHLSPAQRIKQAEDALSELHYYDLVHVSTSASTIIAVNGFDGTATP